MKKIVFIHLLNDFSGSPKVLSQVINTANQTEVDTYLYTCSGGTGFLSSVKAKCFSFPYKHFNNKFLTLLSFFTSQLILFFKLLKYRKDSDVVFYINTMLPFGAALAGKVLGKRVLYHIHETTIKPVILKRFLRSIIKMTASEVVFVSEYLRDVEVFDGVESTVIYNGIADQKYLPRPKKHSELFTVLMICSLRSYKGVHEFITLAKEILKIKPKVCFTLILNASESDVNSFFQNEDLPMNLTIVTKLPDVTHYYLASDLLVNLSILMKLIP